MKKKRKLGRYYCYLGRIIRSKGSLIEEEIANVWFHFKESTNSPPVIVKHPCLKIVFRGYERNTVFIAKFTAKAADLNLIPTFYHSLRVSTLSLACSGDISDMKKLLKEVKNILPSEGFEFYSLDLDDAFEEIQLTLAKEQL